MKNIHKLTASALCLALAMVLPLLTGQIDKIGDMLLPMHLPVMLCGFICGKMWGGAVGFVAPVMRSLIFTRPQMFPTAVRMGFELAAYAFICGLLYEALPKKTWSIYASLAAAMVAGRVVWSAVSLVMVQFFNIEFTLDILVKSAFLTAWPGMIVQFVLIPPLVMLMRKAGMGAKGKIST